MTDLDSALTDLDEGEFPDESLEDDFIGDGARAVAALSDLVLYSLDWSVQSIIERIGGSIDLEPPFQRRDAWTIERKSRYIESLVMGWGVLRILDRFSSSERIGPWLNIAGSSHLNSKLRQYSSCSKPVGQ